MAGRFQKPGRVRVTSGLVAAIALGCGTPAISPASAAPDVTPAQAATLESQVRSGIAALLPPSVRLPDRPVQITASGDHFEMAVLTTAEAPDGSGRARITGTARPVADGSWTVDDLRITSPLRMTYAVPGPADVPGARRTGLTLSTIDIQGQDGRITWDPSFTMPSTWTMSAAGTTVHTEAGSLSQETKVGPSKSVVTMRPAGMDRANLLVDGALQDYTIDTLQNDTPVHIGMQRVSVTSALNGMSRGKAVTLIQALAGMIMTSFAPPDGPQVTPMPTIPPAIIHAVLGAFQDFASEFALDETIDGFAAKLQDQAVGIEHLKLGFSARSDNGIVRAGMDLGVDGLVLPDLPLGESAALLPRRFALHPVVSGLGVPTLTRLANASADGLPAAPADIKELFSHGGIQLALESMMVDVAGTVFSGQAKMTVAGPSADQLGGTAQISAEHFDELIQKLSAMPELTQIVPVLVFAKGIGRLSNDRLVWDLGYRDGKLLVNNMDLTAMTGGGPSSRAQSPSEGGPKTKQPRPSTQKQAPSWGK